MKRVICSTCGQSAKTKQPIKASVDSSYFDRFEHVIDQFLPSTGEGETMATQIVTAINKLVYKWYNDGDVYDNTYYLDGWANDLSSYANWLYENLPKTRRVLDSIEDASTEDEYEQILKMLCDKFLDLEDLENYNAKPKQGTIYNCNGPFRFEEYSDENDYEDEDYDPSMYDPYDEDEDY